MRRAHPDLPTPRVPSPQRSTRGTLALLGCLLVVVTGSARAGGMVRAWGMSKAHTSVGRGLGAVDWNPANLALDQGREVGLASAAADLNNNSFSLYRYNEIAGGTLTEYDKQWILADIPPEGLNLAADVHASALGLRLGPLAVTTRGLGGGHGNLDRDFFSLVLLGNEVGQAVSFNDTYGEGYAVGAATVSFATPLLTATWGRLAAGCNVSYLRGIFEMHVEEAGGSLTTTFTEIQGQAQAAVVTATGGNGWGMDVGLALQAPRGWVCGLVVDNLIGAVHWHRNVERHLFTLDADSINALQEDFAAAVTQRDTTVSIAPFDRRLPRRLRLGVSNQFGAWLLAADLGQGLENRAGTSTRPALSVGTELRALGWIHPRAGVTLGGLNGQSLAAGLGVLVGPCRLDFAALNRGTLVPGDAKGLALAFGSSLEF